MLSYSPAAAQFASTTHTSAEYDGFIGWVISLISTLGEVGVGIALAIEALFPPVPSELILPVAGYLSYAGEMNFAFALFCATVGAMVGAWIFYAIGALIGRERTRWLFEKVPLFEVEDFDRSERVFARWGGLAVLVGRCIPLVRSVISVPAGIERMPLWKFSLYTVIGSGVWNTIWIGLGFVFGPQIDPLLTQYSSLLSRGVVAIIGLLFAWFVVSRTTRLIRARKAPADEDTIVEHTAS
ncbi:membrane protein DedA with SNARE-associated domain [Nocardiopsis sp. Huas11]|uniref:DedA family protein n=1 Tax=Nocardiopsis sp. Huas11 TaxID=2183912 RepID=UPI000EB1584B|nr:DedA family protein [Nocardiopsis sp. Huas11]RKS08386.1 membrane protein DedA with SNARE-associated domain [Nocardiopsis sp. Huas11]